VTQTAYPQPTYPQAPQVPEKKPVPKWPIIVGIIALTLTPIAACGALFTAGGDTAAPGAASATPVTSSVSEEPTPTEESEPAEEPDPIEESPVEYEIGEKATDDAYQFTVTKVKCGVSVVGGAYLNDKAKGQFCLVSLRVKNVGNEAINYSSENQTLVDTKGREHSPDDEAWIYLDDDSDAWGEINPGNTLKTVVPFDVPKKAKPDHLLLKAGVWGFSDGVVVKV
jgi:hypothetical protein